MTVRDKPGADLGEDSVSGAPSVMAKPRPPDPEVKLRPERKRFSASYKRRILAEAEACESDGEVGALLRREGLYSSYLTRWRQKEAHKGLRGSTEGRTGRPKNASLELEHELETLRVKYGQALLKLERAKLLIELQKKAFSLLEIPLVEEQLEAAD